MSAGSITGAASAASFQYQAAATKTALDVQKQEGENAIKLIQSAVQSTEQAIFGTSNTGNNVDVII